MQRTAPLKHLWQMGAALGFDVLHFGVARVRSRTALAAENLFLRKQLALYREREVSPRRATDATRLVLVLLARIFPWRDALLIVQPATLIRWNRQAFRLWSRWRSRGPGRPRIPAELRRLIRSMAHCPRSFPLDTLALGFESELLLLNLPWSAHRASTVAVLLIPIQRHGMLSGTLWPLLALMAIHQCPPGGDVTPFSTIFS